ncbi:MAG: hypothetical protein M3P53_11675 [Actinomycetota bacterium]|nr:hypothetical protein [Actinomycetota bacterium]
MPVAVEGHGDARVAHALLDRFRMRTLLDGESYRGVPEVVLPQVLEASTLLGEPPGLPVEAAGARRVARSVDEDEAVLAGLGSFG